MIPDRDEIVWLIDYLLWMTMAMGLITALFALLYYGCTLLLG